MTNNPSKFSVDFPVIFTDLWPQVTPGWSSGFLIKHVRKRVRRPWELDLRFLKVITAKVPTEGLRRVHVHDTLYGLPTLVKVLGRAKDQVRHDKRSIARSPEAQVSSPQSLADLHSAFPTYHLSRDARKVPA